MPTPRRLTEFEHILIGLTAGRPRSGYDLKRFFASTPAVVYEPSSGALYPALRRLERRGLLRSVVAVSAGKRAQRLHVCTDAGLDTHRRWLRSPVEPATVGRDLGGHLMRFALAEGELTADEVLSFLAELGEALESFIAEMEAFVRDTPLAGVHAGLAVGHGLAVHRASLAWVRATRRAISAAADTPRSPPSAPTAGGGPTPPASRQEAVSMVQLPSGA